MDEKSSQPPEVKEIKEEKKTEWYTFIIDIFKFLLEFNYTKYGTKKEF